MRRFTFASVLALFISFHFTVGAVMNPGDPSLTPASSYTATIVSPASQDSSVPSSEKASAGGGDFEGTLGEILVTIIQNSKLFPNPPWCNNYFENKYYYLNGKSSNGLYWQACWQNDTNTVTFGPEEVATANCLINLHYTQADTCISVKGSVCDNGYIAGGGRLQNLRDLIFGNGHQKAAQLTAAESSALQGATVGILGQNVRGTGGNGPYFWLSKDDSYTTPESYAAQLQVNWIGETAC